MNAVDLDHDKESIALDELVGLFARAADWKMPLDPADWRDLLRHTPILVTARQGGRLVGFARLLSDFVRYANVTDVVVDPALWRRGVGSRLVRSLVDHPSVSRVRTFFLGTAGAHAFYEKLGFERDGAGHWMLLVRRDRDHLLGVDADLTRALRSAKASE